MILRQLQVVCTRFAALLVVLCVGPALPFEPARSRFDFYLVEANIARIVVASNPNELKLKLKTRIKRKITPKRFLFNGFKVTYIL